MSNFKVPDKGDYYTENVILKTRLLIQFGIWEGIEEADFNRWLKNFDTKEDRYFAACILEAFTFRSSKMCASMMRKVIFEIVPMHCRELGIHCFSDIADWRKAVLGTQQLVRFVPVTLHNGLIKSGTVVVRDYQRATDIPSRAIKSTQQIREAISHGTKLIVFLDDFAGTGLQFRRFLREQRKNLKGLGDDIHFLYAPLAAHEDAIKKSLNNEFGVIIKPVDYLYHSDSFFHPGVNGTFRNDGVNSVDDAKAFYENLLTPKLGDRKLYGKHSQELTYSFHFSTPNNNIKALFYENHADGLTWKRLVFRSRG